MQPISKGDYIVVEQGEVTPLIVYFNNSYAVISPPRGVWGHAPPENFGNLDSLRAFLRHFDSHFGADLSSNNFYLSLTCKHNLVHGCFALLPPSLSSLCAPVHIYSISGVRYLESGIVASFRCIIKKHVSCNLGYSLYLVHATCPKKGGSSEPPRTPLCTGLVSASLDSF